MTAAANHDRTHNPFDEACWVSRLRENLTSGSYGEGLETGRASAQVPRQSLTRQLLFKEWKSYANLHAFDTANPTLAEGLIWAAIAAAAMKRFLAHMTQVLRGVEVSTRKAAMCAHHVLVDVFRDLATDQRRRLSARLRAAIDYLAVNAARSHPRRDRRTGRLQLGLNPVCGVA